MATIISIALFLAVPVYGVATYLLGWRLGSKTTKEVIRAELKIATRFGIPPEEWFDADDKSGVREAGPLSKTA